jgi:hypothetical protein
MLETLLRLLPVIIGIAAGYSLGCGSFEVTRVAAVTVDTL